jgi:two-component system nitrogen regulation response regulator GlnG
MIDAALEHSHGKKRLAAELLGWGRNTLTRKLRELGISTTDDDEDS